MLVRLTAGAVPLVPITTFPKLRLVDDNVTGAIPVPFTLMVCGLLLASSVTLSVARRDPIAPGVKGTVIVQFAPAARLAPQLLVSAKSELLTPEKPMLLMLSVTFWPLVNVAVCGVLILPSATEPKARPEAGRSVVAPQPGSLKLEIRVLHRCCVPIWFSVKYSFTYQNVQPLIGSTVMLV